MDVVNREDPSPQNESKTNDDYGEVVLDLKDMDFTEYVDAELQDFVRLAHLGLSEEALHWFDTCLAKHQDMFPVFAEYVDMLLQQGLLQQGPREKVQELLGNLLGELSKIIQETRTLRQLDGTNAGDRKQLFSVMEMVVKLRLGKDRQGDLLAAVRDCRQYIKKEWAKEPSPIQVHIIELYLDLVVEAITRKLIAKADEDEYTNPPWTTEGSTRWLGFGVWYKELRKSEYHWQAQRIFGLLIAQMGYETVLETLIQKVPSTYVAEISQNEGFDEARGLSELVISNTTCKYLMSVDRPQARLIRLTREYLGASHSLKTMLSLHSTLQDIDRGMPLQEVDRLEELFSRWIGGVPVQPLVILCDGTWCGREMDTRSNIYLLARVVGIDIDDPTDTDEHFLKDKAWYIHGVGLGSTFINYIFNGITGQDIADQCITAYKFIVNNYSYPEREIWMFGLSRGAYLVRSVAGLINNCGIIKPVLNNDGTINDAQTDLLCRQAYRIYRSDDSINGPHSAQSQSFRRNASWPLVGDEEAGEPPLRPPVKFMGLFDTVGSLGIPDFVGGVGLDWPQFHDQNVSTVVELVYHAVSLHDRFYIFPPCLAKRKPRVGKPDNFGITQKWFPGVHYDLGRQRFRFLRPFGGGLFERLLARWPWASREIQPNEVLSDLVLRWMLEAMKTNDPNGDVVLISKYNESIEAATQRMVSPNRQCGDGDVYDNIVSYVPFGRMIFRSLTWLYGTRWQTNQIYQLLFALRDRVVADLDSQVYNYYVVDQSLIQEKGEGQEEQAIEGLADMRISRYPSQTFQAWTLCHRILGLD